MMNTMMKITMAAAALMLSVCAQAETLETHTGNLSAEEQALYDKGDIVELYKPDQPSGHRVLFIRPSGGGAKIKVLAFNFGIEDATAARAEGRSMAEFHYSSAQVEQFLFAKGWDKYHDRFFTRAYVQEGLSAYERAK
jgi:hypothetical protein